MHPLRLICTPTGIKIILLLVAPILAYFACDLYDVYMTTRLDGPMTNFLPFNQGSNGAGRDGGAGNPPNPTGGYVTSYFWENVLQKDNLMDILQKWAFVKLQG